MDKKELKDAFKAMWKEVKEDTEAEAKVEEEKVEEEKEVEDTKKAITDEIIKAVKEEMKEVKASKKSEEKAEKLAQVSNIEVKEPRKTFYTTKTGDKLEMSRSQAQDIKTWYNAVLRKDFGQVKKSFGEMESKYSAVYKGGLEPLNESTAADGGVLVPTILANFIVEIQEDLAQIRPNCTEIPMDGMKSNSLDIGKELTNPQVQWEGIEQYDSDKSTTSAQYEKQTLTPYTVAALMSITNQLIEDSPFNMPQILAQQLGRRLALESDRISILGTGVNQPTGLDTYTPSTTINAGGLLGFQHLINAFWAMRQQYRNDSFWVMNSQRVSLVHGLRDTNNMPIFVPSLTTSNPPMLAGRPVLENNFVQNDRIYLVSLKYYYFASKGGIRIRTSDQVTVAGVDHWSRNMTSIRAEERYDSELVDTRGLVMIQNP